MSWFLEALVWVGYFVAFLAFTLCLASGLYYLAELIEEYTVLSKRLIGYVILANLAIHVLLFVFEPYPWYLLAVGLSAHLVYRWALPQFPTADMLNPGFLASAAAAALSHGAWFWHFASEYVEMEELMTIFLLEVWLVPFALLLMLSGSEGLPWETEPERHSRLRTFLAACLPRQVSKSL